MWGGTAVRTPGVTVSSIRPDRSYGPVHRTFSSPARRGRPNIAKGSCAKQGIAGPGARGRKVAVGDLGIDMSCSP